MTNRYNYIYTRANTDVSVNVSLLGGRKGSAGKDSVLPCDLSEGWTLAQACDYCLRTRWRSACNQKSAHTKVNTMLSYFGEETPISSIKTIDIDGYAAYLSDKYKAGTVNLYLNGLSAVLRTAYDRDMLQRMPKIPHIRNRAKRVRYLTEAEETRILEYFADDKDMYDAVCVLIDTGIRKGELFALTCKDVDMESSMLILWETKNGHSRSVPMTERVAAIISSRLHYENRLFPITESSFIRRWERMRLSCGYGDDRDFVPHILRHTCCSRLVQGGAEIVKVSKWMGHNSISTTMIYAHLSPESLSDIKGLLERKHFSFKGGYAKPFLKR